MDDEQESDSTDAASENESPQDASAQDPIKQIKAEFERKTSNLADQQRQTNEQLQAILAEVQKSMQSKESSAPKKSAKELVFDDPEEFVRTVREDAVREATETVSRQYQASQAVQNAVSSLQTQYPEFAQDGSEAAKLAVEKASKLPSKLKGTAEGARLVMLETAQELGLMPVSKRKASGSDEPIVGGRSSSNSTGGQRKPTSGSKVDEKTRAFAELLGLDFNDKTQVAILEKAAARKNWRQYE